MSTRDLVATALSYPIDEIIARYASEKELSLDAAREHAIEAKRYLALCALNPSAVYAMRGPIDGFWHTFITFTSRYADFCARVGGEFIHHVPNTDPRIPITYATSKGRKGESKKDGAKGEMRAAYLRMLKDYESVFGVEPPVHLWPRPAAFEEVVGANCMCVVCRCGCRCLA